MDHRVAEEQNAVERYLLNEFTPEERKIFEEHLFECVVCGDQVRQSAIAIDNLKAVLNETPQNVTRPARSRAKKRGWSEWLRLPVLVPTLATLALASVAAYQTFIHIPALEQPRILSSLVIAPVARAEAPVITVEPRSSRFNLNFAVDVPQAYPAYVCEFRTANESPVLKLDSGPEPVSSFTLGIELPTNKFPRGRYVMILRPASAPQVELQRYSFAIEDGAHH